MEPTLEKSDYIGGFKISPGELQRGDIVIFFSTVDTAYYIKRIIGLPGETVAIFLGTVYIDGQKLEEPYVGHMVSENFGPLRVPENHIFVLGDNRANSFDSRQFGPISISKVEAKASFIYNPITRIGFIEQPPPYRMDAEHSQGN
jgi:signal peptidase I